jgi:hypothetical protein
VRAEIFEALPDHMASSDGDITLLLGKSSLGKREWWLTVTPGGRGGPCRGEGKGSHDSPCLTSREL